jgi:hypothetical protein
MSDERPDEFFSWRSRLGPPDALPEQGLDNRDLTWEKLTRRLGNTPGQDSASLPSGNYASIKNALARLPVYRIAAACLLLLLIPAARLFHNRPTPGITSPRSGTLTARPPGRQAPLILDPAEASPVLRSAPPPKDLVRLQSINNKTRPAKTVLRKTIPQNQFAKPGDSLSSPANPGIVPDPPVQISGLPRSPDPTSSQNTLISKQLKIVHINELDNPSHPEPAMTSIRSRDPDIRVLIILKNH